MTRVGFLWCISTLFVVDVCFSQSQPLILACEYPPTVNRSDPYAIGAVPNAIELATDPAIVKLDGERVDAVTVSDVAITFSHGAWVYTLNRVTGALTFYSPAGQESWKKFRLHALQVATAGGRSPMEALADVERRQSLSFDGQQHVGVCRTVEKRLF